MTKKIFFHSFLLGTLVLILCSALFFGLQYRKMLDESYDTLKGEAKYAASGLETGGISYLKSLEDINRITWIGADGSVLYDSDHPDLQKNQGEYAEVKAAFSGGEGQGIRRSESGGGNMLYYASLLKDGTVLRLSRPISRVQTAFQTVSPVLWVFILVFLISGIISFRMANQILKPVNELDLDNLENSNSYPELSPLINKLQEQTLTIREQEESREELRREFSANISHELKVPLRTISRIAGLIREGTGSEEKTKEYAEDIRKESKRMVALVEDIMELSRLDKAEPPQEWEKVDLYEVAGDVKQELSVQSIEKKVNITVEGSRETIKGIGHLLHEMIYNLCDNAIKYNHEGGNVTVTIGKDDGRPWISVTDDGIGIPLNEQDRVFERFYRVDKSHSQKIGGTGLGLSIVKHGAALHGADVSLKSAPGDGTSITITFPA
ncbi:MAG: two-component sensor histidine kinase [Lachnospiraceae bacterium]|nr:two-component sensor histidine kinase [Lachnospiraceae bacterium]